MSGQQPPVNASSEDNIEDVDFADADLTDDNTDEA